MIKDENSPIHIGAASLFGIAVGVLSFSVIPFLSTPLDVTMRFANKPGLQIGLVMATILHMISTPYIFKKLSWKFAAFTTVCGIITTVVTASVCVSKIDREIYQTLNYWKVLAQFEPPREIFLSSIAYILAGQALLGAYAVAKRYWLKRHPRLMLNI